MLYKSKVGVINLTDMSPDKKEYRDYWYLFQGFRTSETHLRNR